MSSQITAEPKVIHLNAIKEEYLKYFVSPTGGDDTNEIIRVSNGKTRRLRAFTYV